MGDLITFSRTNEVTKPFVHHNGTIIKASNRQRIKHKLQDNSQKYGNINFITELENVQYACRETIRHGSLIDHAKGWSMLRAPLHHLSHVDVKYSHLEDVTPEHLEGNELADLEYACNGNSRPPLIHVSCAIDILELHHPRV
jgi:hypothetical protein